MRIRRSVLSGLCLLCALCLSLQAQETNRPKRPAQLTMDDLDNRAVSPTPSSPNLTAPVVAADEVAAPGSSKKAVSANTNAKAILEAAWKKMASLKSGRMRYTNRSSTEVKEMFYEFDASDRGRIITADTEIIVIAEKAYINAHGEGWKKTTKEELFKSSDLSFKFFANYSSARTSQVQMVSEEAINQIPMLKFKVSEEDGQSNYTWVGKNDGLVYKTEASFRNPERFIQAVYSDFNAEIPIVPPKQ